MPDSRINLYDRVKELTYTVGTNDFTLSGPPNGFSSFGSVYTSGDRLFYAVTDGVDYEVGSGTYHTGIVRYPLRSSNNNNKVSFSAGIKEVYSTYPATHAVLSGSGLDNLNVAKDSGVAFWGSAHTLDYDSSFLWDRDTSRLAIYTTNPEFAIDIGGGPQESIIRSSGIIVSDSGVLFPSGRQVDPFMKNLLGDSNIEAVIELSGISNEYFWLKKQNEGTVFAGPPSGCGDCFDYPAFRGLAKEDYPWLHLASGALENYTEQASGVLDNQISTNITNLSGVYANRFTVANKVAGAYEISGVGLFNESNPNIHLYRGMKYEFNVTAGGSHPFWINLHPSTGNPSENALGESSGVFNNGDGLGVIRFTVPQDAPDTLWYNCANHASMSGKFYVENLRSSFETVSGQAFLGGSASTDLPKASGALNNKINVVSGVLDNYVDVTSGVLDNYIDFCSGMIFTSGTIATSSTAGTPGHLRWDTNYLYVCVHPNTWKRVAISTW